MFSPVQNTAAGEAGRVLLQAWDFTFRQNFNDDITIPETNDIFILVKMFSVMFTRIVFKPKFA